MSNIFRSENLEKDYINFEKALFKTNKFKFILTPDLKPYLKRNHRLIYVIALLDAKIRINDPEKKGNRFLYLNEILSDLLANSSIILLGFFFASQILARRFIENFYNHIYYYDHSIEFELLNRGRNEYTPITELKIYYDNHPITKDHNDKNLKTFNDSIFNHYQELCRTVHTKGSEFMGLARNLQEIKPDINVTEHYERTNQIIENIIYLLYKFHSDVDLTSIEKDIVSKSFPKNLRSALLS